MKFLILQGESSYGALRLMAEKLSFAFDGEHQAEIFDLVGLSVDQVTSRLFNLDYDAVVSLNAVGADLKISYKGQDVPIFSSLPVPHICWMADDVSYHYSRLVIKNPKRVVLTSRLDHSSYLNQIDPSCRSEVFFPGLSFVKNLKSHRMRKYDLIIAASNMGEPVSFWKDASPNIQKIILETIELVESGSEQNSYFAFVSRCHASGFKIELSTEINKILSLIENFLRQRERKVIFKALNQLDCKIALVGSDLDDILRNPNAEIIPAVNSLELSNLYQNSRVVINLNSRCGASERLFDGLSSGCQVLSPWTLDLSNWLGASSRITFVQYPIETNISAGLDNALNMLVDEHTLMMNQDKLLASHSWSRRAEYLRNIVSQISI